MTPPTQSPATAAAEAITEALYQEHDFYCLEYSGGHPDSEVSRGQFAKLIEPFITSAYSSTEQELREARRLLAKSQSQLQFWLEHAREDAEGQDVPRMPQAGRDTLSVIRALSEFLSKNSNLPRE